MIVAVLAYLAGHTFGAFAFAQILGSLQNAQARGLKLTLFTIILWSVLLFTVVYFSFYLPQGATTALGAGLLISLIATLRVKKVE